MHQRGDTAEALNLLDGSSLDRFNTLRDIYDVSGMNIETATYQAEAAVVDRIQVQQTSTIIVALIIFIAATLIALLGPLMMSRAIRQITGRIKEITEGDGDLTARIESSRRDEIGDLAQQFNAFIKRIDDTLQSVSSSTVSLQHASTEIAKGSQELAARTEQAAANLQQTSASMEKSQRWSTTPPILLSKLINWRFQPATWLSRAYTPCTVLSRPWIPLTTLRLKSAASLA